MTNTISWASVSTAATNCTISIVIIVVIIIISASIRVDCRLTLFIAFYMKYVTTAYDYYYLKSKEKICLSVLVQKKNGLPCSCDCVGDDIWCGDVVCLSPFGVYWDNDDGDAIAWFWSWLELLPTDDVDNVACVISWCGWFIIEWKSQIEIQFKLII